jgi:hypothetical protein
MDKIIKVTAPISIENLKLYFEDKEIKFLINYTESTLKKEKIITYLSNLELPCDIIFDQSNDEHIELLKYYFISRNIISAPSLSEEALKVCLEFKNICDYGYQRFIDDNREIVENWVRLIESMSLYNLYTIKSEETENYVKGFNSADCFSLGLNFVNLFSLEDLGLMYENIDENNLLYYPEFFNDYMFKGNSLYHYWANENNPMFIMTWGIMHNVIGEKVEGELM